ncbi:amino acid adenylation domain-containing protein [Sinorhizobium medicae]|nr:amino acid adenylation domain-containing protein [Sinorhizobium medicae]
MNEPVSDFGAFLASPQQEAAFRARGAAPPVYHALTPSTRLARSVLAERLAAIEQLEEVLRCVLREGVEGIVQAPRARPAAVWLDQVHVGKTPESLADQDSRIETVAWRDARLVDPAGGRLLFARPICTDTGLQVLLTASTEIADRASLVAIANRLVACTPSYASQVAYADYAGWRAELLDDPANTAHREVWVFAHPSRPPEPYGDPVPAGVRGRVLHSFDVPRSLLGPAPEASIAALWAHYLARCVDQTAITLLHRFDGRGAPHLTGAIGPYEQVLPVTYSWNVDDPAEAYLQRTREHLTELTRDQQFGAPGAVPPGSAFSAVDVCLVDETGAIPIGAPPAAGVLDLVARIGTHDTGLLLTADPARYAPSDLARFAEGFRVLLEAVATDPSAPITQARSIGPAEAKRLRAVGAGLTEMAPPDVIDSFRAVVARCGNAAAAADDRESIDYRALDARSDAVARLLLSDPRCSSDTFVPILADASVEFLWMVLGVLKAGRAFAPLDPYHPPQRLAGLVTALGRPLALAAERHAEKLQGVCDVFVPGDLDARPGAPLPRPAVDGTAIAYILFTSGSSGAPKGVRVTRAGLANYLHWAGAFYGLDDPDGALVHTSPAVDLTLTALLGPLLRGGRVILPGRRDPIEAAIAALSQDRRIGFLKTTPSLLRTIVAATEPGRAPVGMIVLGGEQLTGRDLESIREHFGAAQVFNEYGPTETVVGSTVYDATHWWGESSAPVPIGAPIAATHVMVLDNFGRPAPFGASGELRIAGAGVASGYLGQAEETVRRFVACDDGPAYLTGDIVRWTAGGHLLALGRADDEFKVNGVRCHPAEVEAALESLPGVREAAAALRADPARHECLVAWYVAGAEAPDSATLRVMLAETLPASLVPARLVRIDGIPRTASGKRDRARLAEPSAAIGQTPYETPQGHVEEVLAAVLASALGIERVGRQDNYFALGGDSLRSVQVSALAHRRGVNVSVAQLHANPVMQDLAAALRQGDSLLDETPATAPFGLISEEDRRHMPAEVEDAYPLNLLQEGMIYHRDFAPKSAVYHAICSYHIRAHLDIALMRQVIHDLVARHPLLRTSFDLTTYSQPLQIVHREFSDPVTVIDLRDASPAAFDAAVNGWMEHEKHIGFEVHQHPLIRYCIHVGAAGIFQLSYSFHHEIIDGWSDAYMVTELLRDYFSRLNGEDFIPERPCASFRDSIAQEQAALANERFRNFWMAEFADAQLMRLPRLATPHRADKGERQIVKFEIPIDGALSNGIKALAHSLAVPVKTVLLTAHMRVMSAMGGGRDTTSYTVGNGRPESTDGHKVIGLFVNSLAFRLPLPGGTWRELIRATLAKEQALLPYRRYPMAELKRQAGNEPLSETLFFFNHYHVADALNARADAELLDIKVYGESTFPYCINAYISPVNKRVGMRVEYDALQFTPRLLATIEQIYLNVIRAMLADVDARYDVVDLLPSGARHEVLALGTCDSTVDAPASVVAQIGAAARNYPDRIAVAHGGGHLTYGALDRLAGGIAAWLRGAGVRPGGRLALVLARSIHLPAVLLGVLRVGCAYVPLDPTQPRERLRRILDGTRPDMVIASDPALVSGAVDLDQLIAEAAGERPIGSLPLPPDLPAYVIYTSGTTGVPKGVEIPHRALALSNAARQAHFPGEHESFLLLSSPAFDSSVAGLFGTLTTGGTLILPSGPDMLDLTDIACLIGRHRVTQTLAVPSLYSAMLREVRYASVSSLRTVSVAGEAVMADLIACHAETLPGVRLVNEYGPTETTVWASAWTADGPVRGATAPCGRPIPGIRCLVLDPFGTPTPIGVAGEACLAGPLVAHGYHGRPAETAAAFRPCPIPTCPGERMYATGDIMRWNPQGQLEFLGRRDEQVKVDGFRIELGEVEAALLAHPRVRSCAVQPKLDTNGQSRLVAYVTSVDKDVLDPAELALHVRRILPRFMLPRAFVVLDRLPLAAGGKIDRAALPDPEEDILPGATLPRTPTEEVLVGIWRVVLGVDSLGIRDAFFSLGGDSLRAMRIAAAVQKALGVQPPLRLMMSGGCTVAELAEYVDAALAPQTAPDVYDSPGVVKEGMDDSVELVRL